MRFGVQRINGKPSFLGNGLFLDGSATAPSAAFLSEPSLGFYRPAAGTLGLSGKLRLGSGVPNASDPLVAVCRTLASAGDSRGFLDETIFNNPAGAYCSYDSEVMLSANADLTHYVGFQVATTLNLQGGHAINNLYGTYVGYHRNAGSALNTYGFYWAPPTGGAVNYGNIFAFFNADPDAAVDFAGTFRTRLTSQLDGDVTIGAGAGSISAKLNRNVVGSSNFLKWQTAGADNWALGCATTGADTNWNLFNYGLGVNALVVDYATCAGSFAGELIAGKPIQPKDYTVATLPAGLVTNFALAFVTDATMTAIAGLGLAPVGGGANKVPVYTTDGGATWLML